ncbi:hypothetical protein LJY25_02305 [Hymenobacter sp. BT175]|uniref:hypothetical protein n=1 Tax=Hymenobacter translucens TaxID=2886507 RepID=UPI001D0F4499|nr:hypothetical protein [Hymenobacter translucens]MCC2545262.1 hypothetical protein [Hymenobacter translucens]
MKKIVASALLALTAALGAQAQQKPSLVQPQDKTQASPRLTPVQERAKRLSDQMVRDLRLNNYQATKLRAINDDKVAKMAAIEQKYASNPKLVEEQCLGVCKERDRELQSVLSNNQYSAYYDARSDFYKFDKDFAARSASYMFVNSVQNPAPASSRGATISPATPKETPATRSSR